MPPAPLGLGVRRLQCVGEVRLGGVDDVVDRGRAPNEGPYPPHHAPASAARPYADDMRPTAAVLLGLLVVADTALGQATTNTPTQSREYKRVGPKPDPTYGWWNDAVFYQVFVRSFADARSGPLAGDGIGDFVGMTERLDYLNDGDPQTTGDLGVTALWIMPMHPSPSYHGYDITDYYGVNPQYGLMEDFEKFVAACHRRGIRVILDLVLNHCSNQHPWFVEARDPKSPKHSWFIWSETKPEYLGPWNAPNWHAQPNLDGNTRWYYGLFSPRMPDLNFRNEAVTAQMQDVVRFWLMRKNVDGFRLDAIRHLIEDGQQQDNTPQTHAWLQRFYTFYKGVRKDAYTVGEVWAPAPDASEYVGDKLDATFDFDLSSAMIASLTGGEAAPLEKALRSNWATFPHNQFGTFLQNHDQPRMMTQLLRPSGTTRAQAEAEMRLAVTLQMLMPGTPYTYYGEEIGMVGDKPDPDIRTPMQWSTAVGAGFTTGNPWRKVNDDYTSVSVAAQDQDPKSLLSLYRDMIRLRTSEPAVRRGGLEVLTAGHKSVLAFVRSEQGGGVETAGNGGVLVIANVSREPVRDLQLNLAGWVPSLTQSWPLGTSGIGALTSGILPIPELPAHTTAVIRVRK